jgi:hypothetical protein
LQARRTPDCGLVRKFSILIPVEEGKYGDQRKDDEIGHEKAAGLFPNAITKEKKEGAKKIDIKEKGNNMKNRK